MPDDTSNRELLAAWQRGDEQAASVLVHRYMVRLTAFARSRLSRKLSRRLDPEDAVLSAWRSFFVATGNGRLTVPGDDDIWPLLVTMTLHKLARQATHHAAQRRDLNVERNLDLQRDWQAAVARDPSPEEAAVLVDEIEFLMTALEPVDRDVLTRRLRGESQADIAKAIKSSERSVGRSLHRIRSAVSQRNSTLDQTESKEVVARPGDAAQDVAPQERRSARYREVETRPEPTIRYDDIILQKLVGQGGFGKVYRAVRRGGAKTVAVKFLKKRFWKDPRATRNLVREATRLADLAHPNIVRHHGWGRSPGGAVFVVMDWIDGMNAGEWARGAHSSVIEIIRCGIMIAGAVAAAHAVGIIHGDLTPANILRRREGDFLLTDFGFAHSLDDPAPSDLGGTPGFLAPEQVSDAFGQVTERTDVYGVGGLLHALLTGQPPMTGRDLPDVLANVLSSRSPLAASIHASGVPRELDQLLLRCLSKEPRDRPSSAAEVGDSLQRISRNLNR